MKITINTLALILLSLPAYTYAAPIDPLSISEASGCNFNSTFNCTVNWETSFETPDLAAVQINRSSGSSWLIRYNLHSPSAFTNNYDYDYDYTGEYTTSVTPYTGNIWLEAPTYLSSSGTNTFNIYTDQVDQNPGSQGYELFIPNFSFGMSAADVLSGSASFSYSGSDGYYPPTSRGSLIVNNFDDLVTCVECGFDVTLNLAGILYYSNQLVVLPGLQANAQLLSYGDSYDYFYKDREFIVSAVPVPGAIWLFSSGLLAVIGLTRKNRNQQV